MVGGSVVERLASMHKGLSSNPNTIKKKKSDTGMIQLTKNNCWEFIKHYTTVFYRRTQRDKEGQLVQEKI
jgi:hypothetical protein